MLQALGAVLVRAAADLPTPSPSSSDFDPDLVTPGWVGFVVTALVVVVTIGLIADMVRRMRRLRYRAEAQEKIAAEQAGAAPSAPEPPAD